METSVGRSPKVEWSHFCFGARLGVYEKSRAQDGKRETGETGSMDRKNCKKFVPYG